MIAADRIYRFYRFADNFITDLFCVRSQLVCDLSARYQIQSVCSLTVNLRMYFALFSACSFCPDIYHQCFCMFLYVSVSFSHCIALRCILMKLKRGSFQLCLTQAACQFVEIIYRIWMIEWSERFVCFCFCFVWIVVELNWRTHLAPFAFMELDRQTCVNWC